MMRLNHPITALLASIFLTLPAYSFSCAITQDSINYDLSALSGIRSSSRFTTTPPSTSESKVLMDLCSSSGIAREEGISDEDQCPGNTKLCVKVLNHKSTSSDPDRVTAIVPIWPVDHPDTAIWMKPQGNNGDEGLGIWIEGKEWAGSHTHLNLTLRCDPSADEAEPTIIYYWSGRLAMIWHTPHACPTGRSGSPSNGHSGGSSEGRSTRGGMGFWGFVKFIFWGILIGLAAYFVLGVFYNHQQYSAKGWDLVPHRDFWREFPVLISDLFGHIFANVRGSGGGSSRGGYSSLG